MSRPPIPLPEINGNIQPSSLREMSEVEAAWVGAVVDTDGCVYRNRNVTVPFTTVSVVNTSLELISALLRVTGTGSIYYRARGWTRWGERKTPTLTWAVGGRKTIRALLERIAPYSTKAQQHLEEAKAI